MRYRLIRATDKVIGTLANVVAVLKETQNPTPLPQLLELVKEAINDGEVVLGILRKAQKEKQEKK